MIPYEPSSIFQRMVYFYLKELSCIPVFYNFPNISKTILIIPVLSYCRDNKYNVSIWSVMFENNYKICSQFFVQILDWLIFVHIIIRLIILVIKSMGKFNDSVKIKTKTNNAKKTPITSHDMKSLKSFMRRLAIDFKNQTSKKILPKIHSIIKKNKQKIYFDCRKIKEKLRICKKCDKWNNIKDIIQCSICEDNYHKTCLNQQIQSLFVCIQCQREGKCTKCKKVVACHSKKHCSRCNSIYHNQCWKNKAKICNKCSTLQRKIKIKQNVRPQNVYKQSILYEDTVNTIQSSLFCYQKLIKNEKEHIKYTQSLQKAIKDKNMSHSQHLVYLDRFQDIMNENSMDFGINFMRNQELEAYQEYKKHPIGPYLFTTIKDKGYDVIADKDIPQKSLICEYIGQVVTLRQCIELQKVSKNDSLMQLQTGKNSDETLIIRPEKYTNMARFINGVKKNSTIGNVETMKLLCKGKPLVLLVAKRLIKKGESLCYDYNAGGIAAEYDTSHFT